VGEAVASRATLALAGELEPLLERPDRLHGIPCFRFRHTIHRMTSRTMSPAFTDPASCVPQGKRIEGGHTGSTEELDIHQRRSTAKSSL
jgi:hypothetical protein